MAGTLYKEILTECRRFVKNEIQPEALENDLAPACDWTAGLWQKSGALELPALCLPEESDGAGMGSDCAAMVLDLLASACAGIASLFATHFAACAVLSAVNAGARCPIPPAPEALFSLALPAFLQNHWPGVRIVEGRLTGSTPPVAAAGIARRFLVFAEHPASDAFALVWTDRSHPGVSAGPPLDLPGLKANPHAPLVFQEVEAAPLLLAGGDEARNLLATAATAYYGFIGAVAMGSARTAYQQALEYARQRYQFGDTIIRHQEVQRMLGEMRMKLDIGTAAYLDLISPDRIRPYFHAPVPELTKACCTDAALEIVLDAIQIHGGYGYMHEYGLEKRMRDIRVLQALGGSNPYLKVRHVAERE